MRHVVLWSIIAASAASWPGCVGELVRGPGGPTGGADASSELPTGPGQLLTEDAWRSDGGGSGGDSRQSGSDAAGPPDPEHGDASVDTTPSDPDLSPAGTMYVCPEVALSGSTAMQKYDAFFDQRGRPQTDKDMGWSQDPGFVTVLNTVRFGEVPASSLATIDTLRDAVDFFPEHHNQTTTPNLTLFQNLGLTESSDAYAKFNPRDYIPASFTRYGGAIMASAFVAKADNPWTELALARCPDCIDGIVTLAAVPADQEVKQHDFFKIFEVRFVTDLAVDAADPTDRMKASSGKVFVSKPFKMLAAIDSSGSVHTHISSLFRPFQTPALKPITIRYRGEIGNHMYNLVQTGDASKVNPWVTGTVALLIRYSEDNDKPLSAVCPAVPVPPGVDPDDVCNVTDWGLWRCGPYGPDGKDAEQVCKNTADGFRWLTNSYVDCATCKIDLFKGCSYGS